MNTLNEARIEKEREVKALEEKAAVLEKRKQAQMKELTDTFKRIGQTEDGKKFVAFIKEKIGATVEQLIDNVSLDERALSLSFERVRAYKNILKFLEETK